MEPPEFYEDTHNIRSGDGEEVQIEIDHLNVTGEIQGDIDNENGVDEAAQIKKRIDTSKFSLFLKVFHLSSHPYALGFHILFKALPVFIYLICTFIASDFVVLLVFLVLLLAIDFWIVKNVSGRLLAGLRWWNKILDDGSSVWIFETRKRGDSFNSNDARLFWIILNGNLLVWVLLGFISALQMNFIWIIIPILACVLSGTNAYFYVLCEKDGKKRLKSFATDYVTSLVAKGMISRLRGGT